MMDFSGSNKGFMFVRYSKPEEAKRAIRELDKIKVIFIKSFSWSDA